MTTRERLTNGRLVDLVLAARDRVATAWTRGAMARRPPEEGARRDRVASKGASVNPNSDEAVAWCMVGAIRAEAPQGWRSDAELSGIVQAAFNESGLLGYGVLDVGRSIQSFNDGEGQHAAIGAFDELARWLKDTGWEPGGRDRDDGDS